MGEILPYQEMRDAMRCCPLSNIVNLDDYFYPRLKNRFAQCAPPAKDKQTQ